MSDKKYGMLIDLSLCIGCNACAVACRLENQPPRGCFNTWIESWDVERSDGYTARVNIPKQCNHCDNPSCVSVCPTGASYKAEDGTVQIDESKCSGCKYCMAACPYGARYSIPDTGVVGKCTYCAHRTENGLLPACVSTCVTSARLFGDLNDPESDISKAIAERGGADYLHSDLGQEPTLCYFGLEEAQAAPRLSAIHRGGNVVVPYEGRN